MQLRPDPEEVFQPAISGGDSAPFAGHPVASSLFSDGSLRSFGPKLLKAQAVDPAWCACTPRNAFHACLSSLFDLFDGEQETILAAEALALLRTGLPLCVFLSCTRGWRGCTTLTLKDRRRMASGRSDT